MQINIHGNINRVDHSHKVRYEVIITNHAAHKYKTPYKGPFCITSCFTNGTVSIKYGLIQIRHNIRHIKPYKTDAKIEDINPKNMCDGVNI